MSIRIGIEDTITEHEFYSIPVKGDIVAVNDKSYLVISVKWTSENGKYMPTIFLV